jgi:UDP-glucose 4-epimerase
MEEVVIIIGKRSNLSQVLSKSLDNTVLISAEKIKCDENIFDAYKQNEIILIFNNFQPSISLHDKDFRPLNYINNSITVTAIILSMISYDDNINKIIYTSSASVYGNNNYSCEDDICSPLNLQASLKMSNEKMIQNFCILSNIDYTITRIFNMYGGFDNFSIISKIISSIKTRSALNIINNGSAIRDYIHIEDVVEVYKKLIRVKGIELINIASGFGVSVRSILDLLKLNDININIKNVNQEEIKISTASTSKLDVLVDTSKFIKVDKFVLEQIKDIRKQ